jgi:hypothetical protein
LLAIFSRAKNRIDTWGSNQLKTETLKPHLEKLDEEIHQQLEALKQNIQFIDAEINTNFSQQFQFIFSEFDDNFRAVGGTFGGVGAGA